jgi:catechol 2,3-dioxygenase-like lactoylglutathione lyase family enzyme
VSQFFGEALHAAFVVPDIESALKRMLLSGVGPLFMMDRIRVPGRYRGRRHDVLITAGFVFSGTMQYEFVQQHDATPSAYLEFLERHPGGGLHHLAYSCDSFDRALKRAAAQGQAFDIVQEFITPEEHPYEIYVEPAGAPDPLLVQLVLPGPFGSFFQQMQEIAASWQGEEPRRDALALLPPQMRPVTEPLA